MINYIPGKYSSKFKITPFLPNNNNNMKKLFTLFTTLLVTVAIWAQSPQKMSYQAVIRNSTNALVINTPIGMKISILQGSASGTAVYSEIQTPTTNANGLISIEIGGGVGFDAIDWPTGSFFIMTETDPTGGTDYTITGTSQLLSVPYALHSKTAESISGGITETDPVFAASPANAISTGNIANWNTAYGWGNHAGLYRPISYVPTWNEITSNPFVFTSAANNQLIKYNSTSGKWENWTANFLTSFTETDPVFGASPAKSITGTNITNWNTAYSWGNHASAGYLTSEVDGSITNEIQSLAISNDSVYLSDGGFIKLPSANAWSLNGNAGTVDGTNFIGTSDNVPLNFKVNNQKAGRIDQNGSTFLGYQSGNLNFTWGNTGFGYQALYSGGTGIENTATGHKALYTNGYGSQNTAIGVSALQNNNSGSWNTADGTQALVSNTIGNSNTAVGYTSLSSNTNGNFNTALGQGAGYNNISGASNVFLGYSAGYNETGSDKLYIANNSTNPPLIYGDFASGNVGLGTITPETKLDVRGMINASGGFCINGDCKSSWASLSPWVSSGTDINYGAGNVGIGTASPSAKLQVNGEAIIDNLTGGSILTLASTSGATPFLTFGGTSGGIIQTAQNTLSMRFGSGGTASSVDFEPAKVTFRTSGFSGYERLTINSVGNVGIGTDTPAAKLDVNGDLIVRGNFYAPGTVVQTIVRTSEVTSSLNVTAFTEANPDYRISITPKYTNSIILIEYNFPINTAMQSNTIFNMQLIRDIGDSETLIGVGPVNGTRNQATYVGRPGNGYDINDQQNIYMIAKDSGLSSGTTYTYGFKYRRETGGIGTCYFNFSLTDGEVVGFSGVMTMKATEIAQ